MGQIPENIGGIPAISGYEGEVERVVAASRGEQVFAVESRVNFATIRSAACVALHMHQPLIPAGGADISTAELISNLKHMFDNPGQGDNHNAATFKWCYQRIGELVPELMDQGFEPRVMLEYSGNLLYGLKQMGLDDVIESLRLVTCNPKYRGAVEWLGCPWGHAVAPSTPVQDYRLHVKAWQQYFMAIFGEEALSRVRGFSPSEMALPNQPDVAFHFVKTLKDCGFTWVLVQEHTVESPQSGHGPELKHLPHRLVCRNSEGEEVSIVALIKTQGSDTKLVAQMQPLYEARSLDRWQIAGKSVPPLVTQIADGENGGVMMNEFPPKFLECVKESSGSDVPLLNGTEYLEFLFGLGIREEDLPTLQPVKQKKLWEAFTPGEGPDKMAKVIEQLQKEDHQFHMEGGSWTNNISWVQGYENVLAPMARASAAFHHHILKPGIASSDPRFREALFYLLCAQTSCYRYWGQGVWTDYGIEICRRCEKSCGSTIG